MPREKTIEETREELLQRIADAAVEHMHNSHLTREAAVVHTVFSIMSILEGSGDFPFCLVLPHPDQRDAPSRRREGEDWYPRAIVTNATEKQALFTGESHHKIAELINKRIKSN
jgi:hypothetical protein